MRGDLLAHVRYRPSGKLLDIAKRKYRKRRNAMIDDKHRHGIAEAMRMCDPKAFGWPIRLASAIAQASDGGQDPLHELANLIDRPTCHISDTDHEFEDSVRCDRCRTTFNRPWEPFKYCPNCGAEVAEKEWDDD